VQCTEMACDRIFIRGMHREPCLLQRWCIAPCTSICTCIVVDRCIHLLWCATPMHTKADVCIGASAIQCHHDAAVDTQAVMQTTMNCIFERLPAKLRDHLLQHSVSASMFLPSWLITVFSADFPLSFSARLIDIMLVEGWQSILVNVSVGLLTVAKQSLLSADSFEAVMDVLKVQHRLACSWCIITTFLCMHVLPSAVCYYATQVSRRLRSSNLQLALRIQELLFSCRTRCLRFL
jgi:Rab-GTPase-TBC domain